MATGPSTSTAPYLVALQPNAYFTSFLTVGDTTAPGGPTGVFGGIPDGIGAFDNHDGTFTMILNHELSGGAGVVRDHGSTGAYIEMLVVDKTTLNVLSADDLIQTVMLWDDATDSYVAGTAAFSRFCSGDLAETGAFYDAATGLGSQARIFLTGEENGPEGRATATLATGADAGTLYELPFLGNLSFENLVANPFAQTKTIVAATDDTGGGQVYIYVGDKQATGSEIEKAGLVDGAFYGIKVDGILSETNDAAASGTFTLQEIGPDGDVSNMTGAAINAESLAEGVTGFLRPEDAAWDPENPNVLYFTTTNSFDGNSRLYKATFADVSNPEAGGTIEAVLDGSEGQHMFDNLTVANGKVILQEDPGNQSYVARVWEYDIASDALKAVAQFDPAQFTPGEPAFITQDEESSGVIDVSALLGNETTRAYLLDAQVHRGTGDPATVEQGQLLQLLVDDRFQLGTKGKDVYQGTEGTDIFFFDNSAKTGTDKIKGFGMEDVLVTTAKIFDSNGDDIIGFGSDKKLDLASGSSVSIYADNGNRIFTLEHDGSYEKDGQTYYVYSRLHSEVDVSTVTADFMDGWVELIAA